MEWPMVAALCFVGLSMILSAYLNSRAQREAIRQQSENTRWVWDRFLTLLEPHLVERVREIEQLEAEDKIEDDPEGVAY
jgi:hypothetical protein